MWGMEDHYLEFVSSDGATLHANFTPQAPLYTVDETVCFDEGLHRIMSCGVNRSVNGWNLTWAGRLYRGRPSLGCQLSKIFTGVYSPCLVCGYDRSPANTNRPDQCVRCGDGYDLDLVEHPEDLHTGYCQGFCVPEG